MISRAYRLSWGFIFTKLKKYFCLLKNIRQLTKCRHAAWYIAHRSAWEQFMRCSIVWSSPHTHASEVLKFHLTSSWRPCIFLHQLKVCSVSSTQSKVGFGRWWGIPPGQCLYFHWAAWLSRLFHFSCYSAILAVNGEVSRGTLVSRKLRLDGSHFRTAVCPWGSCLVSVT